MSEPLVYSREDWAAKVHATARQLYPEWGQLRQAKALIKKEYLSATQRQTALTKILRTFAVAEQGWQEDKPELFRCYFGKEYRQMQYIAIDSLEIKVYTMKEILTTFDWNIMNWTKVVNGGTPAAYFQHFDSEQEFVDSIKAEIKKKS